MAGGDVATATEGVATVDGKIKVLRMLYANLYASTKRKANTHE